MSETIDVSAEFYAFVAAYNRDRETVEDTLWRLVGGPSPETVAGILSSETAVAMRERLTEERRRTGEE